MSAVKTILITGANGQLGSEIKFLASSYPQFNFIFTDYQELSIIDKKAVDDFFSANEIYACINCAAYTAVDKAESEIDLANDINGNAVGYLAEASERCGARFIHVSTDYVFDGTATSPYQVDHPVSPVNVYGKTKLLGEQLAQQKSSKAVVIRTSWVYSSVGNNFVKTMLRLMKERDTLNVVSDQVGRPTYAADLAKAILDIVAVDESQYQPGMYHFSNQGVISWYDFAVAIRDISNSSCAVHPIATDQYPTPAKRPAYSVMDTSKIQQVYGVQIPEWRDSLLKCMDILLKS